MKSVTATQQIAAYQCDDAVMRLRFLIITLVAVLVAPICRSQTTEAELQAKFVGKTVFLRGFWIENKLKFNADGTSKQHYSSGPFTTAGFLVNKAQIKGDELKLEGHREALAFDDKGVMGWVRLPMGITVEIDADGRNFDPALRTVFAADLAEVIPSLPSIWTRYARTKWLHEEMPKKKIEPSTRPDTGQRVGLDSPAERGRVKAPKLLHSVEPHFSDAARTVMASGSVEVYLIIDEQGLPQNISIVRPLGLGLDEAAAAAVSEYRFRPATRDGQPVKVDMYVDVNFQSF